MRLLKGRSGLGAGCADYSLGEDEERRTAVTRGISVEVIGLSPDTTL